jgi:hypothetical protein
MAKQTETGDPKLTGGGKGEPTEVITKKKVDVESKKNYPKSEQACDPGYVAEHGSAACTEWKGLSEEQRKKGETKIETKEVEVKETKEGKDWEGKYQTETKARVLGPLERRKLNRGTKLLANRIARASKRVSKLGTYNETTKEYDMNSGLSDKQRIKFERSNINRGDAKAQLENHQIAAKSGRGIGELVHSGQRDTTQSEAKSLAGQDRSMKRASEKKAKVAEDTRRNQAAEDTTPSSRISDNAIEVPSNQNFLGEVSTDLPSDALTYKSGDYSTSFGAKGKSAVAKKMAGNRSNKSGSAFKMKGYGKR